MKGENSHGHCCLVGERGSNHFATLYLSICQEASKEAAGEMEELHCNLSANGESRRPNVACRTLCLLHGASYYFLRWEKIKKTPSRAALWQNMYASL